MGKLNTKWTRIFFLTRSKNAQNRTSLKGLSLTLWEMRSTASSDRETSSQFTTRWISLILQKWMSKRSQTTILGTSLCTRIWYSSPGALSRFYFSSFILRKHAKMQDLMPLWGGISTLKWRAEGSLPAREHMVSFKWLRTNTSSYSRSAQKLWSLSWKTWWSTL